MKTINLTKSERDVLVNMIGCNRYGGEFLHYVVDDMGVSWFVFERIRYPITNHKVKIVISLARKGIISDSIHGLHVITDIGRETLKQLKDETKNTIQR